MPKEDSYHCSRIGCIHFSNDGINLCIECSTLPEAWAKFQGMKLIVKCERDGTVFTVIPKDYPLPGNIDKLIDCPTCGRGYFLEPDGTWMSDRPLTFLGKGADVI